MVTKHFLQKNFAKKRGQVAVFTTTRLYIFYIAITTFFQKNLQPFPRFSEEYCSHHMKNIHYEDPLLRLSSSIKFSMYSSMLSSVYFEPPNAAKNNREIIMTKIDQAIHSNVVAITTLPPILSFFLLQLRIPSQLNCLAHVSIGRILVDSP